MANELGWLSKYFLWLKGKNWLNEEEEEEDLKSKKSKKPIGMDRLMSLMDKGGRNWLK